MKRQLMHMVTFYDYCCNPIADGTASFFTEDIQKFQKIFFKNPRSEGLREKFLRSLAGEIVIDYYSDDPELNMVQSDEVDIFSEKHFLYGERVFELENCYHFLSPVRAVQTEIDVLSIRFKKHFYPVGKYHLYGAARPTNWFGVEHFCEVRAEGNPVLVNVTPAEITYTEERPPRVKEEDRHFEKYRDNEIYSICYVPFQYGDAPLEIPDELSDEDLAELMRDIPGEGG